MVVDGEHVLAESGAILDYLTERYDTERVLSPTPRPVDSPERLRFRYWMHYAEGSAMPPLLLTLVFQRLRQAPMPFFARPIARSIADKTLRRFVGPQVKLHLDWMESQLGVDGWFAGERFTAADIQMSFPVQAAAVRGGGLADHPKLRSFLERVQARPSYPGRVATGRALPRCRASPSDPAVRQSLPATTAGRSGAGPRVRSARRGLVNRWRRRLRCARRGCSVIRAKLPPRSAWRPMRSSSRVRPGICR